MSNEPEPEREACPICGYPCFPGVCDNPACYANPSIPEPTKERWKKERAERENAKAELDKVRRLQYESFSRRKP